MAIAATMALLLCSAGLADEPKAQTRPDAPEMVPEPGYRPKLGDRVTLHSVTKEGKPSTAWLTADRHDFRDYARSLRARDRAGMREMREAGKMIELESGASVLVIDVEEVRYSEGEYETSTMITVRLLDGEKKGQKLCTPAYYAARLVPRPGTILASPAERAEKVADADRAQSRRDEATAEADRKAKVSRAESLLLAARNLEKGGKAKAAIENYRRIVAEFGGTPSAKPAAERIKALTGK
jgi:hypothetical protein